ncbi:MAG: hypothetical protein KDD58_15005 [Bdellovibrionales bacterium]|nr:hypothetical protein [Bdellovibrionales bacterium]
MRVIGYILHVLLTLTVFTAEASENKCHSELSLNIYKEASESIESLKHRFEKYKFYFDKIHNNLLSTNFDDNGNLDLGFVEHVTNRLLNTQEIAVLTSTGFYIQFEILLDGRINILSPSEKVSPFSMGYAFSTYSPGKQIYYSQDDKSLITLGPSGMIISRYGTKQELHYSHGMKGIVPTSDQYLIWNSDLVRMHNADGSPLPWEYRKEEKVNRATAHPSNPGQIIIADGPRAYLFKNRKVQQVLADDLLPNAQTQASFGHYAIMSNISSGKSVYIFKVNSNEYYQVSNQVFPSVVIDNKWSFDDKYLLIQTLNEMFAFDSQTQKWQQFDTSSFSQIHGTYWLPGENILLTLGETFTEPKVWTVSFWDPQSGLEIGRKRASKEHSSSYPLFFTGLKGSLTDHNFSAFIITREGAVFHWGQLISH